MGASVGGGRGSGKRRMNAEINVVPYIDVMLVLLIIFMVTAPLLNLGVDIELPQSNARPVEQKKEPIVVSLDKDGNLWLTLQGAKNEPVTQDQLVEKVGAYVRNNALAGDAGVAVLVETDYMGCDFVDYFSVARIGGRWQITNKTYAHTGGQPPSP